jgi:murein DD-endopeptidase MepM/ murein hydrolase activator NlpD
VRKATALRAALAALVLAFLLPQLAEGSTKGRKTRKRKATASAQARHGGARRSAHQAEDAPVYGPFLPAEPYLYPQPICPEVDFVVEARVHEESPASAEGQVEPPDADPPEPRPAAARTEATLREFAGKIRSLLRPKTRSARVRLEDVDLSELLSANLLIPVEGASVEKLRDTFLASRGRYRKHLAIDIGAPRGTPVLATSDGEIVKMPRERRGGRTIYMKDPSGQYLFYYAHLSKYAKGISPGVKVRRADVLGYVGSTGHVIGGPHLHFSVARVPVEEDTQREGLAINPYLIFLAGAP